MSTEAFAFSYLHIKGSRSECYMISISQACYLVEIYHSGPEPSICDLECRSRSFKLVSKYTADISLYMYKCMPILKFLLWGFFCFFFGGGAFFLHNHVQSVHSLAYSLDKITRI